MKTIDDKARSFDRLRNLWNEFMPDDDSHESLRRFAGIIGETFDLTLGDPAPKPSLDFADLARANRERCEASFHRRVARVESSIIAMALGVAEEAGEVVGAARALLGITKRKSEIAAADVGDELADLVMYSDLLAQCLGLSLEDCIARKFNRVSERVGSPIRLSSANAGIIDRHAIEPSPLSRRPIDAVTSGPLPSADRLPSDAISTVPLHATACTATVGEEMCGRRATFRGFTRCPLHVND